MKLQAIQSSLFSCTLFFSCYSAPQEGGKPVTGGRPSLGLVLEGGGALGFAHIGVLQWMEEHRIPVSYISGTSMGGLIGGVYASGYSANEARDLIETIDWNQVLRGQVPYRDLSF